MFFFVELGLEKVILLKMTKFSRSDEHKIHSGCVWRKGSWLVGSEVKKLTSHMENGRLLMIVSTVKNKKKIVDGIDDGRGKKN